MMPVAVEGCGQSFRLSHSHQELVEELTIQWWRSSAARESLAGWNVTYLFFSSHSFFLATCLAFVGFNRNCRVAGRDCVVEVHIFWPTHPLQFTSMCRVGPRCRGM